MNKVFFKIIVPNYNNLEWIGRCLDSITDQTFKDWKSVIIDDNSDDFGVSPILQLHQAFHKDKTKVIFSKKKLFNGGARNVGIREDIPSEYTIFVYSI